MNMSRYAGSQIISQLLQAETGKPVPQLCQENGMSRTTLIKVCMSLLDYG